MCFSNDHLPEGGSWEQQYVKPRSSIGYITVAARLTGRLLNELERLYRHNLCAMFLVVPTFMQDISLVGFLRYHMISLQWLWKSWKHMKVSIYRISYYLISEHIPRKGGMCVTKVSFSQAQIDFRDQWYSETPQFLTTECDIRSISFHQRSLLPATYSTIVRFFLHLIIHLL